MGSNSGLVITDPHDKLLYQHIVLFAMSSLKKRIGFNIDDCSLYLATKGLSIDISTLKQALRLLTMTGTLEEFYSKERVQVIYRLP